MEGTKLTFTPETEVYYVHPQLWKASGLGGFWNDCLCIGCLEKRIGRRLQRMTSWLSTLMDLTIQTYQERGDEGLEDQPEPPEASKLDRALRESRVMPVVIRDAAITDMDDLQGVFRRASLSNENDRGLLREHPEWLDLSDEGLLADLEDRIVGSAELLGLDDKGKLAGN